MTDEGTKIRVKKLDGISLFIKMEQCVYTKRKIRKGKFSEENKITVLCACVCTREGARVCVWVWGSGARL